MPSREAPSRRLLRRGLSLVPRRKAAFKRQHPQPPLLECREPVSSALPQRRGFWLVPVLIALVTFTAFLPTLQNEFVGWDDATNFLDNPHYRGLAWTHIRWMWTTHLGHYIPLTWMTLGLDYLLWGMNPVGYHLTSLLLHAANAVVFFFVVHRILTLALPSPSERGHALAVSAGFAALVFAIHPLRVESVAWATERRDVLSGLFYLSAILMYLRACERGARGRGWYWAAVGLFAGALLSKSMVVNLPFVLLILDVYPLRRLGGSIGWWSEPARRIYIEKIPFVVLAAAASAIAVMAQSTVHAAASLAQLSVPGRLPSTAGPAGGVGGLRGSPLAGTRVLSERPADCRGSIYLPGRPRRGDLGRRWPVVQLANLENVEDWNTDNFADCRRCHMCRRRVGSSHLEPGPGLA